MKFTNPPKFFDVALAIAIGVTLAAILFYKL